MKTSLQLKVILTTGLALFAMFFGAGNMVFPLKLGVIAGQHLTPGLIAFIISGVGVPFLGLFAVALYEGNYWKFFRRFGSIPAFLLTFFLILIIGPLFATPRTEVVTFHTLLPSLPLLLQNPYVFDFLYFAIVFLLVCQPSRMIDIIGWILSPIKITAFIILITLGIYTSAASSIMVTPAAKIFQQGFTMGYGTMDLLGTFFYCNIVYRYIAFTCKKVGIESKQSIIKLALWSFILAGCLISLIYVGLSVIAAMHANALQNTPIENLIRQISFIILGSYGSLFVGICVSFACLATAAGLTDVTTSYVHEIIFQEKIPRIVCMLLTLASMYAMAILGFDGIMRIANPILAFIYPVLIVLCLINIINRSP